MKRVAIYARVANKKDNGKELEEQLRELEEYCKEKGYEVTRSISEYRKGRNVSMNLLTVLTDFKNLDAIVLRDKSQICGNKAEAQRFEILANELDIEIECLAE